ncbi:hypothetical protein V8C35DRAFT_72915 [Trichoderma chlorosporum]
MMSSATWNTQDQAMAAASEDDFQQFLDISGMANMGDGMQFDFQGFQDDGSHPIMAQPRQTDAIMSDSDPSNMIPRSDGLLQNHTPAMAPMPSHMMAPSASREAISNIDAQIQYLQQQKFQQQQRQMQEQQATFFANHGHSVPPTPQSLEMTPGSAQFYSQAEQMPSRGAYDRNYHQRMAEQDMAFTPLVSPAVTPLDPHFSMDGAFTVPGAYFSPLTSPALHAQNDSSSNYDHTTHSNNSPVDMDLEQSAVPAINLDLSKKTRKTQATKARSKPSVKSSPISKPLRRKTGPSPAMVSQVLSEVEERNLQASDHGLLPLPAASTDGSDENASVSPENLSEMPPPPIPARRSMSKSPYIRPQLNMQPSHPLLDEQHPPHPATPASLMKLPGSKTKKITTNHQEAPLSDNIESLELPESISNPSLGGSLANARLGDQTPRPEPNLVSKGVTFQSMPSPIVRAAGTSSANQSPLLLPGPSGSGQRKTPQLSARNSRKRSTGSVHASPALLPRISPNIKPLLPGAPGMSVEDQASRLLMSKSNYQNILEGNQVPGVSYPSELSTNLTSKRTSHKIAEQGRRNRINSALQIMASLLPDGKNKIASGDDSDKKDGKQSNASNSKASVVENAIVHMKNLEKENVDLKQELQALKDQLEKLKGPDGTSEVNVAAQDDEKLPRISEEQGGGGPDAQGDVEMSTATAAAGELGESS